MKEKISYQGRGASSPGIERDPSMRNLAISLVLMAFVACVIIFSRFTLTGMTVLDDADVFAGQQTYNVGDMAHIFVTPPGIDYNIEVYGPDNELYAVSLDFPIEKAGTYTVKANLLHENISREITTEFNVIQKEEDIPTVQDENITLQKLQPDMTNATVDAAGDNETAPAASTPKVFNSLAAGASSKKHDIIFDDKDMKQEYAADRKKGSVPVVKMEKGGVKLEIRGAQKNNVKNAWYKDGILHVDSTKIDEAAISIPHEPFSGILSSPKLYIREEGDSGFTLATPYEKNGKSYNKVSIMPEDYEFNVEHFTEYAINSTGNFLTISACLKYINNTADTCTITSADTAYTINKWLINSTDLNKTDNLSAAFDFDVNSTEAWDSSNQANNGTIIGAVWNATGYYGGAYDFDGTGFINASNFTWKAGSPVTVSMWTISDGTTDGSSFGVGSDTNLRFQAHMPWGNILYWDYGNFGGNGRISADFTPYLNKWVHIVLVSSGSENTFKGIYINGRLVVSSTTSDAPTADTVGLTIGCADLDGIYYCNKNSIDQFRIWNRTLSQTEIEQLYAGDVQKYNLSGDAIILTNATYEYTENHKFLASYSPIVYNQSNYNEINPLWLTSACGIGTITADDYDVSAIADGTNDINCYAFNFTTDVGLGLGRIMVCRNTGCAYSCAALQGLTYGSCDCDNGVTWKANGNANYTWQNETQCNFTIIPANTDPPYLRFNQSVPNPFRTGNITLNLNGSTLIGNGNSIGIKVLNNNNTISNVTLYNWTSGIYIANKSQNNTIRYDTFDFSKVYDLNISGDYSNIYLNSFYSNGVNDTGTGNSYCTADTGNFYWEGIANRSIPVTDCGIANITRPVADTNYTAFINTTWHNQSSTHNISYYLLYSLDGTAWTNIARVYDVQSYNWSIASLTKNTSYRFKVIPFDDNYNATNRIVTRLGTLNSAPNVSSVLLNATSANNLTDDNLTVFAVATDPDGDNVELNYNWYNNGTSDTILNMPMTAPDSLNRTYDFSGNDNHGNVSNISMWNSTAGVNGFGAYQFDGVNDYIIIPHNDSLHPSVITVSAWIKTAGSPDYAGIVSKYDNPGGTGYKGYNLAVHADGKIRFDIISTNTYKTAFSDVSIEDDKWHHIIGVYDGSQITVYRDGIAGTPVTCTEGIAYSTKPLYIGFDPYNDFGAKRILKGTIGDVRIWNRALSANEIGLLYENKTNVTHADGTSKGDNWTVKVTPIDQYGLNGSDVFSNDLYIPGNRAPTLASVMLNASSLDNLTSDNLTANPGAVSDKDNDDVTLDYNWYRNGASDTILNMPMTAPDSNSKTYDFSGYGYHGTLIGPTFNSTGGYDGTGAYKFNGTTNYISVGDLPISSNGFTFSVWINPSTMSINGNGILGKKKTSGFLQLEYENDGTVRFVIRKTDGTDIMDLYTNKIVSTNQWTYISATYDSASGGKLYINGVLNISSPNTGDISDFNGGIFEIGRLTGIDARYFDGSIDDVRVYNRSLSANEIALLYENKTNITHADATTPGENWTVKVTPIDQDGLNGSSIFSNGVNITQMFMNVVNQTPSNIPSQIVNETARINPNQNLKIRVNVTAVGGGLQSVWVKVWQTVKADANILWQGLMSIVNGFYQAVVPINYSYPGGLVNYTVYANFTGGNVTQIEGNFSVNRAPTISLAILNATSSDNLTNDNLTAAAVATDPDGDTVELNYNWYKNGISDTVLNMPMTAPDSLSKTYDLSGYSNHGTVINATWNRTAGVNGFGAYEFDGVNTSLNVGDTGSISITGSMTISSWIKSKDTNNIQNVVAKLVYNAADDNSGYMIILQDNTGEVTFAIGNNGYYYVSGTTNVFNSWHHIVGVYDSTGQTIKVYVDGVLEGTTTGVVSSIKANAQNLKIGGMETGNIFDTGRWFNGAIDDVRIYNRTLSANEVKLLYENKTNITHFDATTVGDNWTVKVTPIDSYGLNGSSVFSNGVNITQMLLNFVNQTISSSGRTVNDTYPMAINQNLSININATAIGGGLESVWLIVWQTVKSSANIIWSGLMSLVGGFYQANVTVNSSYPEGVVNYTIYANFTGGSITQTEGNFSIDSINPSVSYGGSTEADGSYKSQEWIFVNVSVVEANFNNITFRLYNSTDLLNETNFTTQTYSVNFTALAYSTYWYNVTVTDLAGNTNSTPTRNITLSITSPIITSISPMNKSGDSDGNMTFSYNVTSAITISNCSLLLDNQVNQTNISIEKNTTLTFSLDNMAAGNYAWSVNCSDSAYNNGASEQRKVAVILSNQHITTNLSLIDVGDITQFYIEHPTYGKMNFSEIVNLSVGMDINSNVNISFNKIGLNSTSLPKLNKSATLSLYNLTFTYPRMLMDGSVCPSSVCTKISYSGGTLVFNVTHFTIYSADEAPSAAAEEVVVAAAAKGGGGAAAAAGGAGCNKDSDCSKGDACLNHLCVKLFDVKIITADSLIESGEQLDFVYMIKGMANISGDIVMNFWLEKDNRNFSSGSDTIYIGSFEEKVEKANIFLPPSTPIGAYNLNVQVAYGNYSARSYRSVQVRMNAPLLLEINLLDMPSFTSDDIFNFSPVLSFNKDAPAQMYLEEKITKGGDIVWRKERDMTVNRSSVLSEKAIRLDPGTYQLEIIGNYEGKTARLVQSFVIEKPSLIRYPSAVGRTTAYLFAAAILAVILAIITYAFLMKRRKKGQLSEGSVPGTGSKPAELLPIPSTPPIETPAEETKAGEAQDYADRMDYEQKMSLLNERIMLCEDYKKKMTLLLDETRDQYMKGLIGKEEYDRKVYGQANIGGLTDWIRYYDDYIKFCMTEMARLEKEKLKK